MDVSNSEEVEQWVQNAVRQFGRLDGAANIAGIAGGTGDTTYATIVSLGHQTKKEHAETEITINRNSKTGTL
jgi:NAD(P)-dependent dehydrogenase (short-subunit alcohol dehydrogenase family)